MTTAKHPMQPVETDCDGIRRFKRNELVAFILANCKYDLNDLSGFPLSAEDRMQLSQLTGYSVSGFGDLSYVDGDTLAAADRMAEGAVDERDARIAVLEEKLAAVREALKVLVPAVFTLHPDDLKP